MLPAGPCEALSCATKEDNSTCDPGYVCDADLGQCVPSLADPTCPQLRELATRVWAFDGTRIRDFDGSFAEWEADFAARVARQQRSQADVATSQKAATKARSQRTTERQDDDQAAKRARKRAADDAERSVARHEARVAELERELADPALYDGSAESARRAGKLDQELARTRAALDAALAAWSEVGDA